MTRYTLTFPLADNNGHTLEDVHASIRAQLGQCFDGWTELDGSGHWRTYPAEPVRVYEVDTDAPNAHELLRSIARYAKNAGSQAAVYLTSSQLTTELV